MAQVSLQISSWYTNLVNFRRNPSAYLSSNKISGSNFVLDILQELCQENVNDETKSHLLILLQEYSVLLLADSHQSIEAAVGTLQGIFQQSSPNGSESYRGQILVTVTSILLAHDQLEHQTSLFSGFVDLLLDVMSKVNQTGQALRAVACLCLQEIESLYPGILSPKLDHFYQMCQLESTFACQNYMMLLVTCLKNAIRRLLDSPERIDEKILTDLLCNRKEPLKPLSLPEEPASLKLHEKFYCTRLDQLPGHVETRELKRAVSFLMDHTQILTGAAHFQLLCQLVNVVKVTPEFSSSIFKPHLLRFMSTQDLPLFYLAFYLRLNFGSQLFSDLEKDMLLKHLLVAIHHPALSIPHRLLLFDWFLHFPLDSKQVPESKCIPSEVDYTRYAAFFPTVFDSADIKLIKLSILSLMFTPGQQHDSAIATLMSCLVSLLKPVMYGVTGKTAVTLFRVLFRYYAQHEDTALAPELQRCILQVVMEQPKFAPYALNFIQAVRHYNPASSLPVEVLEALTKQVVSTPVEEALEKLNYYLMILDRAAYEVKIKPKPTISFLQQLVDLTSFCSDGNWSLGNRYLAVCRSILQFHDTDPVYVELGDLLHSLFTHHQDVDVRDRAKFLYSLLVNISSEKLSTLLLRTPSNAKATPQSLTNLVASSASFPTASPIVHLEKPVIALNRIEEELAIEHGEETENTMEQKGIIHSYWRQLHSPDFQPGVKKLYHIHFTPESSPAFQRILALNLEINTRSKYKQMSDVYIPLLERETSHEPNPLCCRTCLHFQPLEPEDGLFEIKAVFTCEDSTYSCSPQPITLTFYDLFQPFPISSGCRLKLFDELWEHIEAKTHQNDCNSILSITRLTIPQNDMLDIINKKLKNFLLNPLEQDEAKIGIFLPPHFSLLLRVTFPKDNDQVSVVNIATDNWKILPDVDDFLKSLETMQ